MVAAIDLIVVLLGLSALAFVALVVCIAGAVHEAVAERRARAADPTATDAEPRSGDDAVTPTAAVAPDGGPAARTAA